jgi:hypothetical protein
MTTTTPHYEKGSESKIAVVLSCPGQEEEKAQKPAAGQTGDNLEDVLNILRNTYGLNDFERGKITITNAWSQVEYENKTKRRQADDKEILEENNLNQLAYEIKDITDFILCCGDKAKIAVLNLQQQGKLNQNCGIIEVPHLGNLGINNTIKEDVNGDRIISGNGDSPRSSSNRILRLEVVAKKIYEQIVLQKKIKEDIEDWKLRISTLYSSVKNWLGSTSYVTKEKSDVSMYEELMDKYHISSKKLVALDIYCNDQMVATFKPKGLWIIGTKGRIDMLSKKGGVSLIDKPEENDESHWLAYSKDKREGLEFNQDYLLNFLYGCQQ